VIVIRQPLKIPDEKLDQLGPVKVPLSAPAARLIGHRYIDEAPGIDSMGIWECSPGRWRRTIMQEEIAHFLKGRAIFTPEGGEPVEIVAGDTVWFPKNSRGVWDIVEDSRKVYVVIERPGPIRKLKNLIKRAFRR